MRPRMMQSNLELFVLALVQRGIATPYELKTTAGLSLGSTVPTLARLERDALVKAAEEGSRRSRRFSITVKGSKVLKQSWAEQLKCNPTDVDSILRIACLALFNGEVKTCQEFMKRSAERLRGWAGSLRAESERLAETLDASPDGYTFNWLRTYCESVRAETDAIALVELSARINNVIGGRGKTTAARRKVR